jgi:hypothetical protein
VHQECQSLQQQTVIPKKKRKGQESQTKRRSFGSQASPTQEASPMEDEEDEIPGVVKKGGKQVGCVSNWEVSTPKLWHSFEFRGFQNFYIAGEEEDHEGTGSQQMFLEKLAAQ